MEYPYIDLIPAIIKSHMPSVYEGESFTSLEYVSKVSHKMNEVVDEFNNFVKSVVDEVASYKDCTDKDNDLFKRTIEQKFADFTNIITLKYQSQDKVIDDAISEMISTLPEKLEECINTMYSDGEFDTIVYKAVGNLKNDFDALNKSINNYNTTMNKSFANLVTDIESYKQNVSTNFSNFKNEVNEQLENFETTSSLADMQKSVYDTNNNGVVDNAEKLGGNLPEYYAKHEDLVATNNNIELIRISVENNNNNLKTVQEQSNNADTKANEAKNTANNALSLVNGKLGANETARDSSLLDGKSASYYGEATNDIIEYTHAKTGTIHYINGTGNNIKFVATADYAEGDVFYVNGTEVTSRMINGKPLSKNFFTSGNIVVCWLNGNVLNFNSGGASGGITVEELIEALQYSGLGLTQDMTEEEVLNTLIEAFPELVDFTVYLKHIVSSSTYGYFLLNWNENGVDREEKIESTNNRTVTIGESVQFTYSKITTLIDNVQGIRTTGTATTFTINTGETYSLSGGVGHNASWTITFKGKM